MSERQISINHKALLNMASRLESLGFTGDSYAVAEKLVLNVLLDGYKALEAPVPSTGPGASREAIEAAKEAARAAVDAARRKRTERGESAA